ncbi:retrovirus-related Pol polyprotein from transposon TNT 1-94 [Cucumis melo var. makuwa]|uniref:Retrovirus-related Pol polyprotein from transposon TNT 1-94 n=1 Tax=Cucumis melo var. makuwa TaxID=1194695 RepID=A0A5A7SU02_CUCMM|nr:retrovirus-related Pol polyprotein from transposon TNT 1-94 [Cucumis melo var. makuwa]
MKPPPPSPNILSSTAAGRHPFSPSPSLCSGTVSVSVVGNLTTPAFFRRGPAISELPLGLTHPNAAVRPSSHRVHRRPVALRRVEAEPVVGLLQVAKRPRRRTPKTVARGCPSSRDLTLKFLGPTASSFGNSSLYSGNVTASCSLCAIGCKELFTDRHRCPDVLYVVVYCLDIDHGVLSWKDCVSFGITRLIRASFGITRLICASFGITRLICASLGITRLIGKGTTRGRPMRGRKDADDIEKDFGDLLVSDKDKEIVPSMQDVNIIEKKEDDSSSMPKEWRYAPSHPKDLILGNSEQGEPRSSKDAECDEF